MLSDFVDLLVLERQDDALSPTPFSQDVLCSGFALLVNELAIPAADDGLKTEQ